MTHKVSRSLKFAAALLPVVILAGCSAPILRAPAENNEKVKKFVAPEAGKAGLYVYRDSFLARSMRKAVHLDGTCLGRTEDRVFFYTQVEGNRSHRITTESDFADEHLDVQMEAGKNYYVRQIIRLGPLRHGARLEQVADAEGQRVVSKPEVKLALGNDCDQ